MLFLIVGLGNPGSTYAASRHNMGFQVLDLIAQRHGISWEKAGAARPEAAWGRGFIEETRVLLVKPLTYMNLSGTAVAPVCVRLQLPPERIAVVHDDVDLDLGRVQVRHGGGHGGHRGLRSVIEALGEADFVRFRVGVGRPPDGGGMTDFVLGGFGPEQEGSAHSAVARAADAVATWIRDGLTTAMNRYNSWPPREGEDETG